jgi:hypothetical protein
LIIWLSLAAVVVVIATAMAAVQVVCRLHLLFQLVLLLQSQLAQAVQVAQAPAYLQQAQLEVTRYFLQLLQTAVALVALVILVKAATAVLVVAAISAEKQVFQGKVATAVILTQALQIMEVQAVAVKQRKAEMALLQ